MISTYTLTTILGLGASVLVWWVLRSRFESTLPAVSRGRLALIAFGGLGGAGLGAKLAFLIAEGYAYRGDWLALLTGRSITGALLGGYLGVEITKRLVGHRGHTGDLFAVGVPIGVAVGRLGCVLRGCCAGVECHRARWWAWSDAAGVFRWPSQLAELGFNVVFLAWVIIATKRDWARGNRFHVYLIGYGVFRFGHEFVRDTARWAWWFSGYQAIALVIVAVGTVGFLKRRRAGARGIVAAA